VLTPWDGREYGAERTGVMSAAHPAGPLQEGPMERRHLGFAVSGIILWSIAGTAAPAQAALPRELPAFDVVQAGLSSDQAARLGAAFGVDVAFADGSVRYVSKSFGDVPMKAGVVTGKDEDGNRTVGHSFDLGAIRKLKPVTNKDALTLVRRAFDQADVPLPDGAQPTVGHTTLHVKQKKGGSFSAQIATSVRYQLRLAGYPLIGPGADIGVTLDDQGTVTDMRESAYIVQQGATVALIPAVHALAQCKSQYPRGSRVSLGLVYFAPELGGRVSQLLPWYECSGKTPQGAALVSALVPAVQNATPTVAIETALGQGGSVSARVHITGGRAPYAVQWLDSRSDLAPSRSSGRSVDFRVSGSGARTDHLMVLVTDSNGMTGQAATDVRVRTRGPRSATLRGFGVTPASVGRLDVGAELNVTQWNCVQQSAAGFQSEFSSHGIPIAFRWLAPNAWERDFRDTATKGGDDANYVDNVDLAWYTGHGNPGGFTFDNSAHDDGSIVPTDARWGDRDLEWLQLESCNVLQFTDGSGTPIWSRWSQTFDGLHMLNGFQTTAECVDVSGGTSGRFSDWLLGRNFGLFTLPPLKVRQAWAMMALDLEPSGRQYVSMGVFGQGGVTDYDDYFWGLGPVGPDIPKSQITGYWWLVGTV
jgi:Family of unknown function (DUF6345)